MALYDKLKPRLDELVERDWDMAAIEARFNALVQHGIPKKAVDREMLKREKKQIQERVRLRAEEYNFYLHNCAQSTALALMEEFGLGSMDNVKALAPFPGIGGSGQICGGVSGSLAAFGLFFSTDNWLDAEATGNAMMHAKKLMEDFKEQLEYLTCADIQEYAIFGRNMDPGGSEEKMENFAQARGFEKCSIVPGIAVGLAAGYLIDYLIKT